MKAANGRFVWYELMTTDVDAARAFYTEIVGWKTTSVPEMDYEMWDAGDQQVGGLMKLTDEARAQGVPPNWLAFVQVEDIDATVKKAERLGAKVVVPGTDIPNIGRFAVLADPQGAVFALYRSNTPHDTSPNPRKVGHFGWAELNTTDWEAAWRFYAELFGWKNTETMDMGPEFGPYFMFGVDQGESLGAMSNAAGMMKMPPSWLHYVRVPDVDAAVKQIEQKGGKVLNGPMDVPGGDRVAQCMDPQGAMFAIFSGK